MEVCWLPGWGLRERFGKGLALVQRLEVLLGTWVKFSRISFNAHRYWMAGIQTLWPPHKLTTINTITRLFRTVSLLTQTT
ncbi:hypothetical protein Hanom_Chr15g01343131 [Helianthus anomalus]